MAPRKAKAPKIIIGIDFGTTFSGVAWATITKPDQVNTITNWNSKLIHNSDKEKSPTAIAYTDPTSWGYGIPLNQEPIKWFKLLLLDEEDLQTHLKASNHMIAARNQLQQANKNAVAIIADFLREIWSHSLVNIKRAIGEEILDLSQLKVVVTLPAIWPTYAQARMRQAASLAGLLELRPAGDTDLSFISEPEAAALATMTDLSGRADVKKDDHYIVCDAGGGTVDLITYVVVSAKPMVVRESVQGSGDLCGGIFLDEPFMQQLKKKVPRTVWPKLGPAGLRRLVNDNWENGIKPQFSDDGSPWQIPLPFTEVGHLPEITFDNSEILAIYKPVVNRICQLVSDQIGQVKREFRKNPKYVVLVGGFGKSRYLYQYLEEHLDKHVQILQSSGERPWTAICRGAVIYGLTQEKLGKSLSISVGSRIARASYGTLYNVLPWEKHEHDTIDRAWCPIEHAFLAVDQVKWFLKIGDKMQSGIPVSHSFWRNVETPEDDISTELVISKERKPSHRFDETVKQLCVIRWSTIPDFDTLPVWENPEGKVFRQIAYDIKMFTDGGSLEFRVFHKGQEVASKNVSIDFRHNGHQDAEDSNPGGVATPRSSTPAS